MTLLLRWRWGRTRPSAAGSPRETLVAVRPLLEDLLRVWSDQELVCRWSSLHDTAPVGGPPDQPRYCNAVMLVEGLRFQVFFELF